jgi:succinoglycan biosynthesis protein ExoM
MAESIPHISVCVCTFKRPHLLSRLLDGLNRQLTEASFTYSIVIVDNDVSQSSRQVVHRFRNRSALEVSYCVEPEQNIALARNRALVDADGYFIAFIDDDELPAADWLLKLFQACQTFQVDGVLGPVIPHFEQDPPSWVTRGGFCDRPAHPTGFKIDWEEGRTGNLLIRREILDGIDPIFRPEFGSGGEDRNFFRRMIEHGRVFTWCNEAVAYEWIPPLRCKRSFMIRRALLRGKMALNHHRSPGDLAKSLFAVIGYTLALPILFVIGHHFFMKYLIKVCDHSGKLLAFIGLEPVGKKYILE